jgi:hypothetical protein
VSHRRGSASRNTVKHHRPLLDRVGVSKAQSGDSTTSSTARRHSESARQALRDSLFPQQESVSEPAHRRQSQQRHRLAARKQRHRHSTATTSTTRIPARATSRASKHSEHSASSVSRQRWLQHREAWNPGQHSRIESRVSAATRIPVRQTTTSDDRRQHLFSKTRPPRGRITAYRTPLSQQHSTPGRASSGQRDSGSGGGPYAHHTSAPQREHPPRSRPPSERTGC